MCLSSGLAWLGLAVLGAHAEVNTSLTAEQACRQLESATADALECDVEGGELAIRAGSPEILDAAQRKHFPAQSFQGHKVRVQTASDAAKAFPVSIARTKALDLRDAVSRVDFDNSNVRGTYAGVLNVQGTSARTLSGSAVLPHAGPPGSGDEKKKASPRKGPPGSGEKVDPAPARKGPPGSGERTGPPGGGERTGPPGGGRRNGPPGSGGGNTPPDGGNTAPPSRPAPVWRSRFPPPPPNWWNTATWDHYDWWDVPPSGYDRPSYDRRNESQYVYFSGWYPWSDILYSEGRTADSAVIVRGARTESETRTLTSRGYQDAKQCYYRAVYRYDWEEGGFEGSHWEEHFDHYQARCVRLPRRWDRPDEIEVTIAFDLSRAQTLSDGTLDLPWITDSIGIIYDGANVRYDDLNAAFQYEKVVQSRRNGSEIVLFTAGARKRAAPERDKVKAFLKKEGGRIQLVIDDTRAKYYEGERLEVAVAVKWDKPWSLFDPAVLEHKQNVNPIIIQVNAAKPQQTFDVPTLKDGEYWIDGWSFRRVDSALSSEHWIGRGEGNRITK
jgi:hypothetical protein